MDSLLVIQRAFTKVEYFSYGVDRTPAFPGTPKERYRYQTALFYDWLEANDATFHRDLLIVRNGVKLSEDDELAFKLCELDTIQIFDQPKGIIGDISARFSKLSARSSRSLLPKPAIANTGGNTIDSPNNSLTRQTNTARVYKAKPDIYGQIRSYPDLIQESLLVMFGRMKMMVD